VKTRIYCLALLLMSLNSFAQTITLAWDANEDVTITGLKLYTGPVSGPYSTVTEIAANSTTFDIPVVFSNVYSFYLTATNAAGLESEPSNSVRFMLLQLENSLTNQVDVSVSAIDWSGAEIVNSPQHGILSGSPPFLTYVYTNLSALTNKESFGIKTADISSGTNIINFYSLRINLTEPLPPLQLKAE